MYNCEEYYEYLVFVGLPLFWHTIYHKVNNHITLFQHMDLKLQLLTREAKQVLPVQIQNGLLQIKHNECTL